MARRILGVVAFTLGILVVVTVSMLAGVALFGMRTEAMPEKPCIESKPRPLNLLEVAQKRFGLKIYSQWNEETIIRHFFNDQRDGFFVDIGAASCCSDSTTYYLESRLGWTGIAVDSNVSYRAEYEKRRRGSKFFSFFVSDTSDKQADFFLVPHAPGISSGDRSHLSKFDFMKEKPLDVEEKKITTITLNRLLERERVQKIDFLSLDIEGAELVALHGFDIDKYKPRLVCVEIQQELGDKILEYFTRHGYQRIEPYRPFDQYNWYFMPVGTGKGTASQQGG
jgi:FkbM family methyltransferase